MRCEWPGIAGGIAPPRVAGSAIVSDERATTSSRSIACAKARRTSGFENGSRSARKPTKVMPRFE